MDYERLLAKSGRDGKDHRPAQTIRKHTSEVMKAADRLVEVTGRAQLEALRLTPDVWFDRFRREVRVAALLHDLGKANSHFQEMVHSPGRFRLQGLRHEAVSFLIARLPEVREWVHPALEESHSAELVLWAIAGHHRKFPPTAAPDGAGASMRVYLDHPDFRRAMELGVRDLGLAEPHTFAPGHALGQLRLTSLDGIFGEFRRARQEAAVVWASLDDEEKRYLATLKACLICADVAGSIGRRGAEPMVDWIPRAFERVPKVGQLREIVARRLEGKSRYPSQDRFQHDVAERTEPVAFVNAGCGSGKTAAAYLWAARQAERSGRDRRLFFCYPTTGTATEGYRDYLRDPALMADLSHGRSDVDKELLGLVWSGVETDMESPDLGDDEADRVEMEGSRARKRGAADDSADALEQWSTPLVSCTVDTVLGLVQNNRRGLYAWPSIAGAACVFDEVHSYDDALFDALLRFLADVPGVPCLLMTASLPDDRLRRLRTTLAKRTVSQDLEPIPGPEDLETVPRYRREIVATVDEAWERARQVHHNGGKVLWVVNTVGVALDLADDPRATDLGAILYHSRFKYVDRIERHKEVISAFKVKINPGSALAITTQVAELSLDLEGVDLLITELAPIPALIQRLGRLNRQAKPDRSTGTRPFIVLEPKGILPYAAGELDEARRWLEELRGELSQRDLIRHWVAPPVPPADRDRQVIWLDGGFFTEPRPLRESSPGIEVILEEDAERVRRGDVRPEKVRIPMPPVPKGLNWMAWPEVGFCRVPPADCIEKYDSRKGARWKPR